ncbi:MAG TPA: hypothetical protein VNU01_03000 [Egibacteraceae bacterium]|nr:hypothetical protein [Egibacteraceae bacterium]
MPDLWAYCSPCARWFYCARSGRDPVDECPACGVPSRTRQDRHPARATADAPDRDATQES